MKPPAKSDRCSVVVAGDFCKLAAPDRKISRSTPVSTTPRPPPIPKNTRFRPETIYTLSWNFSPLTVAVGALAIWLIWHGHRFNLVLVVALLVWQLGLMESRKLWDYLV